MVFVFYNKMLLRLLVAIIGASVGVVSWYYVALSAAKLPAQGASDALAIISFLISGWLVMVVAEVLDYHYVRVFGCLCVGLGAYISHPWIFRTDGPKLLELPQGPAGMRLIYLGFWVAMCLAAVMFVLLVVRLVLDRLAYGRRPPALAGADVNLGAAPPRAGAVPAAPELPPIPVDRSPMAVGKTPSTAAVTSRTPAPVGKLVGIGGMYLGHEFKLGPGEYSLGRQDTDFELADDKQVSRAHARLSVTDDGLATLTDLGSTNGTFVNDQRVEHAALAPGDVIRIGTTLFKVES